MQVRGSRMVDCGTRPAKPLLSEGDLLWRIGPLRITPPEFAPMDGTSDGTAPRMGPMTAIIYFGEILVASSLAIVLLAISQLRMSSDAVLFAGGVVAWTLAEYVVHRFVLHGIATDRTSAASCQPRRRGPHNFYHQSHRRFATRNFEYIHW